MPMRSLVNALLDIEERAEAVSGSIQRERDKLNGRIMAEVSHIKEQIARETDAELEIIREKIEHSTEARLLAIDEKCRQEEARLESFKSPKKQEEMRGYLFERLTAWTV